MAVIRKIYNFEAYIKPIHFNYLGMLLLTMTALWFYFTFAEFLTTGYVGLTEEWHVFTSKVTGQFSLLFWFMILIMGMAFFLLALARKKWPIGSTCIASAFIIVGMWIERYSIIVPTLTKYNEHGRAARIYAPTWVEWSITSRECGRFCFVVCGLCQTVSPYLDLGGRRGGRSLEDETGENEKLSTG